MPYFVHGGPRSGEGAGEDLDPMMGYWLRLRGTTVVAQWGPVEVLDHPRGRVCWRGKVKEKRHPCESADLARKLMRSLADDLLRPEKGYRPLGFRVRIFPQRKRRPKAAAPRASAARPLGSGGPQAPRRGEGTVDRAT